MDMFDEQAFHRFSMLLEVAAQEFARVGNQGKSESPPPSLPCSSVEEGEFRPSPSRSPPRALNEETDDEYTCSSSLPHKKRMLVTGKSYPKKKKKMPNAKERAKEPVMPENMRKFILHVIKGRDIEWVNTHLIYDADIKKNQNRLGLPSEVGLVLSKEEKDYFSPFSVKELEVCVLDPRCEVWKMNFKCWPSIPRFVLNKLWNDFVTANQIIRSAHTAEIWTFRDYSREHNLTEGKQNQNGGAQNQTEGNQEKRGALCFAINIVPTKKKDVSDSESGVRTSDACPKEHSSEPQRVGATKNADREANNGSDRESGGATTGEDGEKKDGSDLES